MVIVIRDGERERSWRCSLLSIILFILKPEGFLKIIIVLNPVFILLFCLLCLLLFFFCFFLGGDGMCEKISEEGRAKRLHCASGLFSLNWGICMQILGSPTQSNDISALSSLARLSLLHGFFFFFMAIVCKSMPPGGCKKNCLWNGLWAHSGTHPQLYSELVNHSPLGKHSYDGRIAVLNKSILQKGGEAAPEGEKNTLIA